MESRESSFVTLLLVNPSFQLKQYIVTYFKKILPFHSLQQIQLLWKVCFLFFDQTEYFWIISSSLFPTLVCITGVAAYSHQPLWIHVHFHFLLNRAGKQRQMFELLKQLMPGLTSNQTQSLFKHGSGQGRDEMTHCSSGGRWTRHILHMWSVRMLRLIGTSKHNAGPRCSSKYSHHIEGTRMRKFAVQWTLAFVH